MRTMQFGKTGMTVAEVGFGCIPIIRLPKDEAGRVLCHAFERGITFYDTAHLYLDSEEKIGAALGHVRDRIVLATKTRHREGKAALAELEESLRRLRTDWIDLYQLHQLSKPEELEAATARGGVLEALQKAKEQGKIRHIGFSCTAWRWPGSWWPPAVRVRAVPLQPHRDRGRDHAPSRGL
jgi:aryl-alcohol dehydrogenase-like predicted oxidoreductase